MASRYTFNTKNLYTLLLCLQVFDIFNFMIISELVGKGFIAISPGTQMALQVMVVLVTVKAATSGRRAKGLLALIASFLSGRAVGGGDAAVAVLASGSTLT